MIVFARRFVGALLLAALGACGSETPLPSALPPVLDAVSGPTPILPGSILHASGTADGEPSLVLTDVDSQTSITLELDAGALRDELIFDVTADAITELGEGEHTLTAKLVVGTLASNEVDVTLTFASSLDVALDDVPDGDVHRNDIIVIHGDGFLAPGEGTVVASIDGSFTRDSGGSPVTVSATETVVQAELYSRDRGLLRLTTDLGGVGPGTFVGTVTLASTPIDGAPSDSAAVNVSFHFGLPEVIALTPTSASLGAYVTLQGAGFLGGADRPDETTSLYLEGMFTPRFGDAAPFGPVEPVSEFVTGQAVRFTIETAIDEDNLLVSSLFGAARGLFRGTAEVVVGRGSEEARSGPTEGGFVLGAVKQVVYLRFLPGFYDSLSRFGLGSAAGAIEDGIKERIETIYMDYNVDVRLDEPQDYKLYAIIEIGGPDPNGTGLFGYDNSPGKDIGNIRLYDEIGGLNAETQSDGAAGYGGVFVDSLLFFSSHPELPGSNSFLEPEPLFDEIFDPVRARQATLAEVEGEGDPARVAEVARAVRALSSIIGETTSHELGHSLGLAQPYGPLDAYHDEGDEEGCIMEPGGARPIGERAAEPGFAETHFCYDEPDYLMSILAR